MAISVCLLKPSEVQELQDDNVRPDCSNHQHISKAKALQALMLGEIEIIQHYFVRNGTYARRKDPEKLRWKNVTQMFMGEPLGYVTKQLVR